MNVLKKTNWLMIFSLLLWCVITLIRVLNHSPWYDEAHEWLISQELNLIEIIKLMKIEGHTILWYLVLMPFAKNNFMYPYSMLLLNWLFCFIAILILWLKAPFSNGVKFLISFSFPFLVVYSILARCYSIGIMMLFAITALENRKLEYPNWYALLLTMCVNTSITAAAGAAVFGLVFVYDLIKYKKNVFVPFIIFGIGGVLIFMQLLGADTSALIKMPMNIQFFSSLIFQNIFINITAIVLFGVLLAFFYIKNKIFPKFLILSYLILFITNCVYLGFCWHHFFYYIYFIISCWLLKENYKNLKMEYIVNLILLCVSFLLIFYKASPYFYNNILFNNSKISASIIKNDDYLKDSNFILIGFAGYELYPYLKNSGINFVNYCSGEKFNYDSKSFFKSEYCNSSDVNDANMLVYIYGDRLNELLKVGKNFIVSNKTLSNNILFTSDRKYVIVFKLYKALKKDLYIYSIEKKINNRL